MAKKVVVILADGFEEIEAIAPVDILRRGEVSVDMMSITDSRQVTGSHGIAIEADGVLDNCSPEDYDMVLVPGGPGVKILLTDERLPGFLRAFSEKGKWVASICAGPKVLANAGILRNKRITSYPSEKDALLPNVGEYSNEGVVIDGNVITSRGPGFAIPFGLTLLELLAGSEMASIVKDKMLIG